MALRRRDLVVGSTVAFLSWTFTTHWAPSLRFIPYAIACGAFISLGLFLLLILTTSRPLHSGSPASKYSTVSLSFTTSETWTKEVSTLRTRHKYSKPHIWGLGPSLSTSVDSTIHLIVRDFVKSWYSKLSIGNVFPNEIDSGIRLSLGELVRRLQGIDVVDLLVTRLLPIFSEHVQSYVEAENQVRGRDKSRRFSTSDELNIAIPAKYRNGDLHPAASLAASRTNALKQKHLQGVVERILPLVLPQNMTTSASVTILIREIITCAVLLPVIQMLSDPDFLNQHIETFGRTLLHDKRTVEMLRVALNEHASPQSNQSARRRLPRLSPSDSQGTFEKLIQAVRHSREATEAQSLRDDIALQLTAESDAGAANYIYLQRLEILHTLLKQKIQQLPKSATGGGDQQPPKGLQEASSSNQAGPTLRDVLYDAQGLSYFMEYMDQLGLVTYVQFWIIVDGFRSSLNNLHDANNLRPSAKEAEHQMLKRLSNSFLWKPELNIPVQSQRDVENFVTNGDQATQVQYGKARDAVLQAGANVFQEMNDGHYPAFKRSPLYKRWLQSAKKTGDAPLMIKASRLMPPPSRPSDVRTKPELRRAVASSSDLFSTAPKPAPNPESRRSLDDFAVRKPLFDEGDDDSADLMAVSTQSLGSVDSGLDSPKLSIEDQSQAVDAVQAALNDIVVKESRSQEPSDGPRSEAGSTRSSLDLPRGRERSLSPERGRPSLASLGLVGTPARRTVFTEDDLFGENEKLWEEDTLETEGTNDPAQEIEEAAPGDLGLAEVIQELTIEIDKLEAQRSIVNSLTGKAELVNNAAELRILRKSKASLDREIHRRELQRQQYIVQESDHTLYGKAKVDIRNIMVGSEPDGHEFALYVIEVHRQGTNRATGATWAIARRYSEFHMLHRRLRARFPFVRNIEFPRRQVVLTLHKEFLKKRRLVLERYLRELLTQPAICRSLEFRAFLSQQAIHPAHISGVGQVDRQDFVSRIYNSVSDGMEEFFGDMPALQQLSLAGQNLISAATSASISTAKVGSTAQDNRTSLEVSGAYMPAAIADDPRTAAEAQAEISAFESPSANGHSNVSQCDSHRSTRYTTFIAPIAAAFLTIFQLNTGNAWLRGRAVVVVLQQLLGGTIERKVRDTCRSTLLSADALARNIDLLREAIWPAGGARAPPPIRTTKNKERSRKEAAIILETLFEDAAGAVVGRNAAKDAGRRISRLLSNERLNAHLVFTVFDEIVEAVFGVVVPALKV